MSHLSCEQVRDLAAELALGSTTGEERAHALVHLSECSECRALVEELSRTADSMLLLAPQHEPPIGFETRALARFTNRRRRVSWRWVAVAALFAVLCSAATGAFVAQRGRVDHRLAAAYKRIIAQIGGHSLRAAELRSLTGTAVGKVYAYDGKPSLVFLVLNDREGNGQFEVELDPLVGDSIRLAGLQMKSGKAYWATTAALQIDQIQSVNIIDSTGVPVYGAEFQKPK